MYREMEGSSWRRLAFLASISLQFVLGSLCVDLEKLRAFFATHIVLNIRHLLSLFDMILFPGLSGDSKNTNKAESHTSSSRTGTKVILVLLGFVAVAMFSFFLYKLWQKKKRDEQYARLLKLFEEDDELEVELGLRD
ncbi:unnamed protein product [Brassica rapa]|uniref:Uncharacterized protein n=1 Tax=Brassica campestris TaxID=3711 RepID=A0A8D9D0K2_BRACM|nr:unnamed protein product [Brassica rapa]